MNGVTMHLYFETFKSALLNPRPFEFGRPFELVNVAFWSLSENKNLVQFQFFLNFAFLLIPKFTI